MIAFIAHTKKKNLHSLNLNIVILKTKNDKNDNNDN